MDGYGQFCPVSLAAEIFAQRWTPLIVRELLSGSTRFNELRRGMPTISTSMLSRRLDELVEAGVVERREAANMTHYNLTAAGEELRPVVEQLGVWGKRWLPSEYRTEDLDPRLLLWDIHRNVRLEKIERRTVIELHFPDAQKEHRVFWLLLSPDRSEVCLTHPGGDVDVHLRSDVRTFTEIWMGLITWESALRTRKLSLIGSAEMRRALPGWFRLSTFAGIRGRRGPSAAGAPAPTPPMGAAQRRS